MLVEIHLSILRQRCSMATTWVTHILLSVLFNTFIENLLAKTVSLPHQVLSASVTDALSHLIRAWSDEPRL